MSQTTTAPTRDQLIKDAKNVPQLLADAKAMDPEMYAALTGSHVPTAWVAPVAGAVAWVAAKYGLGWDQDTSDAIAGFIIVACTAAYHYLAPKIGKDKS